MQSFYIIYAILSLSYRKGIVVWAIIMTFNLILCIVRLIQQEKLCWLKICWNIMDFVQVILWELFIRKGLSWCKNNRRKIKYEVASGFAHLPENAGLVEKWHFRRLASKSSRHRRGKCHPKITAVISCSARWCRCGDERGFRSLRRATSVPPLDRVRARPGA